MYQAIWRSDGERIGMFYMHAANEVDVLTEAAAFSAEHPELDLLGEGDGIGVSVRVLPKAQGLTPSKSARKGQFLPAHLPQRQHAFATNPVLLAAMHDAGLGLEPDADMGDAPVRTSAPSEAATRPPGPSGTPRQRARSECRSISPRIHRFDSSEGTATRGSSRPNSAPCT
jgi:hypothetical protein